MPPRRHLRRPARAPILRAARRLAFAGALRVAVRGCLLVAGLAVGGTPAQGAPRPASAAASAASAPASRPAVRGDLVTDYAGVKVADPYRALEDLRSPATRAWAEGQAARTRRQLDALPGIKALRTRVAALDADRTAGVRDVQVTRGGRWFYLKRKPGEDASKLVVRERLDGPERVLLDPQMWLLQTSHPHAIERFVVSPDGRRVAVVVSVGDAELAELRVYDVATGRVVGTPVADVRDDVPVAWHRDGRTLEYGRGQEIEERGGATYGRMQLLEHRVDGGEDRPLAGYGLAHGLEVREKDHLRSDASGSTRWTVVGRAEGLAGPMRVSVAESAQLERDPAHTTWTPVFGEDEGIDDYAVVGHWLYARTALDAPRYRLWRYDLDRPTSPPIEIVPQQDGVIDALAVAQDGLYFVVRTGTVGALWMVPHGAAPGTARRVDLPFPGTVTMNDGGPDVPGIVFALEGWTHDAVLLRAQGTKVSTVALAPRTTSHVGEDWVTEDVACTSHDGAKVPMTVVHRRGVAMDGSHPVLLEGYGGYGLTETARFDRRLEAFFERGGVFAQAGPRGGGALGRDWYQAGIGPRKSNTWRDMIACGEALIERGYTTKAKLAIQGTSLGGIAVGRAVTERPDLFAVGIVRAGITDVVRYVEATGNGPEHALELGTLQSEEGVQQVLATSTYHQVRDGTKYPAMLFTAAMNDPRVPPWMAFKTCARMSEATSSGRPVLLRIDDEGGHGLGATAAQRNAELVDRLAFVLWNTGDPAFQPVAPSSPRTSGSPASAPGGKAASD
jgi:prolyl oligopeptidase